MIPLAEARAMVLDAVHPLAPVDLPVADALGTVTAADVVTPAPVPPFTNSAMDGYALRATDTTGAPLTLRVVGTTLAGTPPHPGALGQGEAVRIMTGAPLPEGADAVCMVERTEPGAAPTRVRILDAVAPGTFVRCAGDDLAEGDVAIVAGTRLGPGHLGVLASLGVRTVTARPRPRVGVLSTGDELVADTTPLGPGQIRDANRPSLCAAVRAAACIPVDLGVVADIADDVKRVLTEGAARCDLLVASGGVSVGDADVVKAVLSELCGETARWLQVAIRPAKPFAFGLLGDAGVPFIGLPGNPVSAMVSFELFVRPALGALAGLPADALDRPTPVAIADEDLPRPDDGKVHFVRVLATNGADGRLHVRPTGPQQSHVLSAMARANALAVVPVAPGVHTGEPVRLLVFAPDDVTCADGVLPVLPW